MLIFALEKFNKYSIFLENLLNSKFNSANVSDVLGSNLGHTRA